MPDMTALQRLVIFKTITKSTASVKFICYKFATK